jgi:hypothetical protein
MTTQFGQSSGIILMFSSVPNARISLTIDTMTKIKVYPIPLANPSISVYLTGFLAAYASARPITIQFVIIKPT